MFFRPHQALDDAADAVVKNKSPHSPAGQSRAGQGRATRAHSWHTEAQTHVHDADRFGS